jgi:hypothetical protein
MARATVHLSVKGEDGQTLCDRAVESLWDRALFKIEEVGVLLNLKEDHNVCKPCLQAADQPRQRLRQGRRPYRQTTAKGE